VTRSAQADFRNSLVKNNIGGAAVSKFRILIMVFALVLITGYAQAENIWFSPLTAIPVGPAGPPSNLVVSPYCCPSTALEVTSTQPVNEDAFQWILLGLTTQANKAIKGVQVCYEVITGSPGSTSTYISQVRLTTMTTPDQAHVIHDDPTNLTETGPTCYTSNTTKPKPKVGGTTTLALKMVFGNTSDKILIGGVKLIY
jgi:hypothetical protein